MMSTHGSPELDEDAAKLLAMGADPGLTLEDLDVTTSAPAAPALRYTIGNGRHICRDHHPIFRVAMPLTTEREVLSESELNGVARRIVDLLNHHGVYPFPSELPDCGHGHVHPAPVVAKCGGPGVCVMCSIDAQALAAIAAPAPAEVVGSVRPAGLLTQMVADLIEKRDCAQPCWLWDLSEEIVSAIQAHPTPMLKAGISPYAASRPSRDAAGEAEPVAWFYQFELTDDDGLLTGEWRSAVVTGSRPADLKTRRNIRPLVFGDARPPAPSTEAERVAGLEAVARDALRDLRWVYDTFGLDHGAGVARGTINRLQALLAQEPSP
jgi:hypothetical protein